MIPAQHPIRWGRCASFLFSQKRKRLSSWFLLFRQHRSGSLPVTNISEQIFAWSPVFPNLSPGRQFGRKEEQKEFVMGVPIGEGMGVSFIVPITLQSGPLSTFVLISSFLLVSAGLAQFGMATRHKRLDEISP